MGSGLMQEATAAQGTKYVTPGIPEVIRQAGAESCVLLENDGTLPLKAEEEIAVFGGCQLDWFYVGYGSGGDVHAPYKVNLMEGLKNAGAKYNHKLADTYVYSTGVEDNRVDHVWSGHWPLTYPDLQPTGGMARCPAIHSPHVVI